MVRVALKQIKIPSGKIIKIPALKPKIIGGKKVLVPIGRSELPTLDVMPYWRNRGNIKNGNVSIKANTFSIPISTKKHPKGIPLSINIPPPKIIKKTFDSPYNALKKRPVKRIVIQPKPTPLKSTVASKQNMKTVNQKKFVEWTKKNFPKLYQASLMDMQSKSLSGFGDFFTNITNSLTDLAPSYLQFKQQKDLMKMQLKRAQAGLPPANVDAYTPVIKTRIDLAPDTRAAVVGGMKDMLMPLAISGGILLLVLAMKKRR